MPKSVLAAVLAAAYLLGCGITASGQKAPAPELNGPGGPRWSLVSFACQFQCSGRHLVPEHHEVAGVLDAMTDGDAVLMFLGAWHGLNGMTREEILALKVTFAAQDADLRRVALAVNRCGHRLRFAPRNPDDRVSLRLEQVALADLLKALSAFGEVKGPV